MIYYRVGLVAVWEFSQFFETSSLFDLPQESSSIHDIDNDLRHIPVMMATLWAHQEVTTGDKPSQALPPGVNSKYSNNAESFQFWAESVKFDNNTIIMWRIRNMPILLAVTGRHYSHYTNILITLYTLNAGWASPRLNHPHLGQSPNWDDVHVQVHLVRKTCPDMRWSEGWEMWSEFVSFAADYCCSTAVHMCQSVRPSIFAAKNLGSFWTLGLRLTSQ